MRNLRSVPRFFQAFKPRTPIMIAKAPRELEHPQTSPTHKPKSQPVACETRRQTRRQEQVPHDLPSGLYADPILL